ncbi:type VI secretion system tip protein VgrG [Salmonella enterica]|nr:type VI secretion system tip protein VgrG [Salmonella enterica]EJJ0164597.1 type VI secretion system tip protein VgrG [Salmonella enterica]EJJ0291286.1 type VI secretion system tip protein VgrG [Salmonella enterica]EJJ4379504.1 type VI secretion system tip protein VgrG [Salmonella enterica]EJJ4463219.1 type VI secretion system tip protein VgrG [Salmonella enterica]
MSQTGLRFTVSVGNFPAETFAVTRFHLSQSYSSLFTLDIHTVSERTTLQASELLEQTAQLAIWQGDTPLRYVTGLITGLERGEYDGRKTTYSLTVRPPFWRSSLRQNFRHFQQQDIQSIIQRILDDNRVGDSAYLLDEAHPAREFCVQYNETDYEFLCRLMAEEGMFFYEEHARKGTRQMLVFCDRVVCLPDAFPLPFNPQPRGTTTECISRFRHNAQIRPAYVIAKDYTFKAPGWQARYRNDTTDLNGQRNQYEVLDYPGRFKDEQHGRDFARYQTEGRRNDAETAFGSSNSPKLWPGTRFTLTDHPADDLNREWQVVVSELHGEQPQAIPGTRQEGTTLVNDFQVIPTDKTWRPAPLLKPKVDGPQPAVVTGPEGEEIFCDEHGRVRVKFLWDRYHKANEDSSCWIRVSQPWAGAGFGHLAIPRVGQEVIVDFLNGDPDQPIIMGRTYHQDNRSPGSLPGTKTQMTIRSKTYKGDGFNELRFEDATANEQIYIHAQKNMDTEVLNNRTTDVQVNHHETIGANQTITVKQNQIQTVMQNQQEMVGQNQSITVGLNQAETVGIVRSLSVGVAYQTTVGGVMNTSVALMQSSQVGIQKSLLVGKGYDVSVGENVSFSVGKTRTESTGKVAVYSAGEHLELRCGQARLVLAQDGGIFLNGTAINLQGAQAISGDGPMINWNCGAAKNPPDAAEQ